MYGYTSYGLPTFRRIAGGTVQDFEYGFDPLTGNLLRRRDNNHSSSWEEFTYDSLDRLISAGGQEVRYALNGNLLGREEDETMTYGTGDHSYQVTGYSATILPFSSVNSQSISYTSYGRPLEITESNRLQSTSKTASFTYGAGGDRIRMVVTNSADTLLTRYYIGERYERDKAARETVKRLYLGGDAYSAPMVLCMVSGTWKVYQIGRDYLGSITQMIDEDGEVIEESSYDPWGRRRNVESLYSYASGAEPDLFLGRGYTGHEHLPWFGLVNMNARLYDPLVGRFLSPDPYVQAPDFTQNFNRYSYALNNPLKYSDKSGESIVVAAIVGAILGGYFGGVMSNGTFNPSKWDLSSKKTWKYIAGGAITGLITSTLGASITAAMTAEHVGIGASTIGSVFTSTTNSILTGLYSDEDVDMKINFGVFSWNMTQGKLESFKKGDTLGNIGYSLGGLGIVADILRGNNPDEIQLQVENLSDLENGNIDPWGHIQLLTKEGESLIDFGPREPGKAFWGFETGRNNWISYASDGRINQVIDIPNNVFKKGIVIKGVNVNTLRRISDKLNSSPGFYNFALRSCSSVAARALTLSGVPMYGLHPYLVQAQAFLWNGGLRPWSFSYMFQY